MTQVATKAVSASLTTANFRYLNHVAGSWLYAPAVQKGLEGKDGGQLMT
jgi:hypothetical protein